MASGVSEMGGGGGEEKEEKNFQAVIAAAKESVELSHLSLSPLLQTYINFSGNLQRSHNRKSYKRWQFLISEDHRPLFDISV